MAVELKLKEDNGKLVRENDICLYDGETLKITLSTDMEFDYFYAFINNINIGKFRSLDFGIHSSKLKNGANELVLDFFDEENLPIMPLSATIIKKDGMRGSISVEKGLSDLSQQIIELSKQITSIKTWMQEIDNERSGI